MASANKILIISYEFPPNVGGIGNHAYNLAKALSNENFEVTVMTDVIDVGTHELNDFASEQNFKIHWIRRRRIVFLSYLKRIVTAINLATKANKIICTGKFPLWLGIILRTLHWQKELIAVAHGSELDLKSWLPRKLTAYALGKFNKIISVSNYTQQHLPPGLSSIIKKFVIHNGINCEEFEEYKMQNAKCKINSTNDPTETKNQRSETKLEGEPALITIGSVTERKGQQNVINALPVIQSVYPSVKYHVVGKPVIAERLKQKAEALQVQNAVHFYGAINRDELIQKLSGAHIKLMLSNHTSDGDFEGFGISILEANAFGIPAIGSRDSGIADAIVHEQTGLLINQHDPKEVRDAVKKIMNNYTFYSANATRKAIQYDWKNIVKEYIAVLKK